jgi:hypothetical protein
MQLDKKSGIDFGLKPLMQADVAKQLKSEIDLHKRNID